MWQNLATAMARESVPPLRRGSTGTRTPAAAQDPALALRYAKTADDVDVAFVTLGAGPRVLVLFPYHVSHLSLTTLVPPQRRGLEFLAQACTAVPVDLRGSGHSTRACGPLSLEMFSRDLEAVRLALGTARVAICAVGSAALVACAYAARHPTRVSRLVFIQAGESEANRRLLGVRRANPALEARLRGEVLASRYGAGTVAAMAAAARAALQPAQLAEWEALLDASDLAELAARVDMPALSVHAAEDDLVDEAAAMAFVAALPDGRSWKAVRGSGLGIWDDFDTMQAIRRFLTGRPSTGILPVETRQDGRLSERQLAVLHLLASGRTNREIANTLHISVHTVSFHLRGIFGKTGATNRTEAAAYAHRIGLVP